MLLKLDGVLRRLVLEFVDARDGYSVWTVLTKDCSGRRRREAALAAPTAALASLRVGDDVPGSGGAPPIIFLDVDGVLNRIDGDAGDDDDGDGDVASDGDNASDASSDDEFADRLEGRLLRRVQRLSSATTPRAAVVLSSDWRAQPEARDYVRARLERLGVAMVGCTPVARDRAFARPAEILEWLRNHVDKHNGRFVVLDDRDLNREVCGSHLREARRFVRTDPKRGFSEADLDAAIAVLQRDDLAEVLKILQNKGFVATPAKTSPPKQAASAGRAPRRDRAAAPPARHRTP